MENPKPELPDFEGMDEYVQAVVTQTNMKPEDIIAPQWVMYLHKTAIGPLISYTSLQNGQPMTIVFDVESANAYATRFLQLQAGMVN